MSFIILDRDGVINYDSEDYIKSPAEWHPIPGSLDAIAQLNRANFKVFVATNQSGIARGYYDLRTLDLIHEKFKRELAAVGGHVEEIFHCPHHPKDRCDCRKPQPGLIHKIKNKYAVDLSKTYFIGDSHVDMLAATSAGCKPLLVLTGNGQFVRSHHPELTHIPNFRDLADAVNYVLSVKNSSDDK